MIFLEMLKVALQSIRANFFRAMLTMLGIIIGVAAVITMVSLGTGAQQAINEQLDNLGGNIMRAGLGINQADEEGFCRCSLDCKSVARARNQLCVLDVGFPERSARKQPA